MHEGLIVKIRFSPAIVQEYAVRCPEWVPEQIEAPGVYDLTSEEARTVMLDAEYNSDRTVFDIGPYDMPLGTFNAYRALARQIKAKLEED